MEKKNKDTAKKKQSRRDFMRKGAMAAVGAGVIANKAQATAVKNILPSTILGANEKILTGHIGTGGMGRANLSFVMRRNDMLPAAICDLYPANMEKAAKVARYKNKKCTTHHDFREVLDNKDIDAVVIATPDHWHCLCTLYAADAGKDIYCEKPLSTTIEEGAAMVDAVRRNNVVFQGGTMQRSGAQFQEAVELIKSGYIGEVPRIETFNHENKDLAGIGMGETDMSKYPGIDWDFHQGWVEHQPFNSNRWIYNFRWFLDYSGGKITDWGAHLLDIALWTKGDDAVQPKSVCATGGKFVMQDNRTTPDTLDVLWEYDNFILSFTNRVYNGYLPEGYSDHGIIFHGTNGTMRLDRGGYEIYSIQNNGGCEPKKGGESQMNEPHWQNFADCVRDRKDPICKVETINNTTRTCHMGTCSYVAGGAKLGWDAEKQEFTGGDKKAVKVANKWAYREYQNGWKLKAPYSKG